MADVATSAVAVRQGPSLLDKQMHKKTPAWISGVIIAVALVGGLAYIGFHVAGDLGNITLGSTWPYVLLGTALAIALGFEFVNGFHDTANAVATVIYTHSLEPNIAVVWSGLCNLAGVLTSAGTVAFTIITLLPVELILKVSSGAGFAMVFSLLIAAILWNLGTWYLGLPASSTHTMTGSIIGVGVANQLMSSGAGGTSGVDWEQALKVFRVLLISPLVGFGYAAVLFMILKPKTRAWGLLLSAPATAFACIFLFQLAWGWTIVWAIAVPAVLWLAFRAIPTPDALFKSPEGEQPPPFPIRVLLILTCGGVSYFHGSNDGQKGMGLIMLILIGTVPTAYALNHAVTPAQTQDFIAVSNQTEQVLNKYVRQSAISANTEDDLKAYVRTRKFGDNTM